jgi:hypothetical protein
VVAKQVEIDRLTRTHAGELEKMKEEVSAQLPRIALVATERAQQEWQRRCEAEVSVFVMVV